MSGEEIKLQKLKDAVLEKRPALKNVLDYNGNKSVFDYVKSYVTEKSAVVCKARQQEFISVLADEVGVRLGGDVAESVSRQLNEYFYLSTADHFGPIYHAWVLNFNLLASTIYLESGDPNLRNVINLACANISLNNIYFPRGFGFNSNSTGVLKTHRLSFLPSNSHGSPVYGFRSYKMSEIKKVLDVVNELRNRNEIRPQYKDKLAELITDIYDRPGLFDFNFYTEQITSTNFYLWDRLLKEKNKKINFVYLEQEWIAAKLLIKHHFFKDTILNKILFSEKGSGLLEKHFDGLYMSFILASKYNTYLFWGLHKNGDMKRIQLWKKDGRLVSDDGSVSVNITPEDLSRALEEKRIVPSVLLVFLTICFYYGVTCLGGLGQINYLVGMKKAYAALASDLGDEFSREVCESVPTYKLGGEITVAFTANQNGELSPSTSSDFLLYGDDNSLEVFVEQAKKITLEEAIVPTFPEDYPITHALGSRDPELSVITGKDVARIMGLDRKIKPCVNI